MKNITTSLVVYEPSGIRTHEGSAITQGQEHNPSANWAESQKDALTFSHVFIRDWN